MRSSLCATSIFINMFCDWSIERFVETKTPVMSIANANLPVSRRPGYADNSDHECLLNHYLRSITWYDL